MTASPPWQHPAAAVLLGTVLFACGGPAQTCHTTSGNLCAVAGSGKAGLGAEREPALQSELFQPHDVTVAPNGRVLVVDTNNHRIREIDEAGIINTLIGTGSIGSANDGPPLLVGLNRPTDVSFDAEGRLLLSAWQNHRILRRVTDQAMRVIAGTGKRGFNGDGAAALQTNFDLPVNVVAEPGGALLVADQGNLRIRRIDAVGQVQTVAGTGEAGSAGDGGPATQAQIQGPSGQAASPSLKIAVSPGGGFFIADSGNHRVRKVDAAGVISTFAGTGEAGYSGDGGPATEAALSRPSDLAVAADGTVFIADTDNSCIRKVAPDGVISTVAGRCGQSGNEGDEGPATEALLSRPFGISLAEDGRLFVADTFNHRVRVVIP